MALALHLSMLRRPSTPPASRGIASHDRNVERQRSEPSEAQIRAASYHI